MPVYIEDSHAGSYYWFVENLSLTRELQLVLVDAHSDADQVFDSDAIRREVLRGASDGRLGEVLRGWRSQGVIQCFDWIEPLLPRPISRVCWIAGESLSAEQLAFKRQAVAEHIDAHLLARPRQGGGYGSKVQVTDMRGFVQPRAPFVASVDLDYFAEGEGNLEKTLDMLLANPRLQALTFAISRPYLASEAQSHQLLYETLDYLTRVVNADIRYEPFVGTGPDRSERAKQLYAQNLEVPRYSIERAPPRLRSLIVRNSARIAVSVQRERWLKLVESWRSQVPRIELSAGEVVSVDQPFRIDLKSEGSPKWKVLLPGGPRYNLAGADQGFADQAPRYIVYREKTFAQGKRSLDVQDLLPFLDPRTGWGTVRVSCEVGDSLSNQVCLSRFQGEGFPGKLSEIFNLPYIYGSALLKSDGKVSADARYGADCAHFLIYARRRMGDRLAYLNPKELLPFLVETDEFRRFRGGLAEGVRGPMRVTPEEVSQGVLLHFGQHVAALMESGVLSENSRVAHQLEGVPEVIPLSALIKKYPSFRLMRFKQYLRTRVGVCSTLPRESRPVP